MNDQINQFLSSNQSQYYWAEDLLYFDEKLYKLGNKNNSLAALAVKFSQTENSTIEIKRLNFFIGRNNSGKSMFLRRLFSSRLPVVRYLKGKEIEFNKMFNYFYDPRVRNDGDCFFDAQYAINSLNKLEKILEKQMVATVTEVEEILEELYDRMYTDDAKYTEYMYLNKSEYQKIYEKIINIIKRVELAIYTENRQGSERIIMEQLTSAKQVISKALQNPLPEKYYIPILRGMRPVQSESPYRNRTQKDYFADIEHIDIENILTGESLYTHIQQQLLGKPQGRQTIQKYQEKLSQYFFNNLEVTLIPELESDMLCIKIGEDEQFPVAQLGDGLQQVIILTYHAFTQQDAVCSFFIEEPELHMHPGMLRQLMNFYLNETEHYYFFTTHSNHLLDMADESNEVMIQKFVKKSPDQFHIYRCGRDRDLLQSLGVRPSSVYLANCTIWVEGITDRLYLAKYLEKYLRELEQSDAEAYRRYRRFMPNYHYAFVEYSGGNIVHWHFGEEFVSQNEDKGMNAKAVVSDMLLIADGDNLGKAERVEGWTQELTEQNVYILPCKEIENTLPYDVIIAVAKALFNRKRQETKKGFDIEKLDSINCDDRDNFFFNQETGIGGVLDDAIREDGTDKSLFSGSGVGTIADKLNFCHAVLKEMDNLGDNWQLTPSARNLCDRIFQHIERNNDEAQ